MNTFPIPRNLRDTAHAEGRETWLASLHPTVRALEQRWSVTVGAPYQPGGNTAWVAPAHGDAIGDVVVKVEWRHPEAQHEADALRAWDGDGAVRLYADVDFDDTIALLIERCVPATPLSARPEPDQDIVIAHLLRRLWREPGAGHPFRPLQEMCDAWADQFERTLATSRPPLDHGLARHGVALFRALPASAPREVLLCTDLHAGNVVAAQREPWLAIDPKPYLGDPTYDALQHLLNCAERLHRDPQGLTRRMADLLELDVERLLAWLFARCVIECQDDPSLAHVARSIAPQ